MRRMILLAFLFLLPAISYAEPSIVFDAENFDFGTVVQGETLEHTFDFTNTGDKELVIERVAASWGCAAAVASSDHLKPGEKGKITAKIDIRGRTGALSKSVQVFSNDPKRRSVSLSVKAIIKQH